MYFQQKKTINQKHNVTNLLLRTHHFCNVVLELDFLSYCSTDEYPEKLDRLIRFNNAIQVRSIARFLTFNLCEQGLTIHFSFQYPERERLLAHNEGKSSLLRLVVLVETSQT